MPTQGTEDDVEEEQPSRTVKKEKKGGRKPIIDDDEEEDADGEGVGAPIENDRIDVNNFPDQPLSKEHATNLAGILRDWDMMRKTNSESTKGAIVSIAVSMADLMDGEESKAVSASLVTINNAHAKSL